MQFGFFLIIALLSVWIYRRVVNSRWLKSFIESLTPKPDTDKDVLEDLDQAEAGVKARAVTAMREAKAKRQTAVTMRKRTK